MRLLLISLLFFSYVAHAGSFELVRATSYPELYIVKPYSKRPSHKTIKEVTLPPGYDYWAGLKFCAKIRPGVPSRVSIRVMATPDSDSQILAHHAFRDTSEPCAQYEPFPLPVHNTTLYIEYKMEQYTHTLNTTAVGLVWLYAVKED